MMKTPYKHTAAAIYNHQFWVEETAPKKLKEVHDKFLRDAGFTIITFNEHYFEEQGYTCFWLLGESHLAIHTFPESKKSYIELSSCNKEKLDDFIEKTKSSNL